MLADAVAIISMTVTVGTTLDELDFLRKVAVKLGMKLAPSFRRTNEPRCDWRRHVVQYRAQGKELPV